MNSKHIAWEELRRRYENGEGTYRSLGAEYGISASRISQKATQEGWSKKKKVPKRKRKETVQQWLSEAAQQLSQAAQGAVYDGGKEKLSVRELKELAGVLKELIQLQKTMAASDVPQQKRVRVVLDEEVEKWSV